ncbi:MAG: sulfatase [Candidatus Hydrogenedentes bacterium]|nr:sulfatase [Candidatus Hydrogenedentota bacterium]
MLALLMAACFATPDVYLISVDTLRADRLGCYGYDKNTTPNLDAFAKKALLFEDCLAEVPLTSPSFGAMMTSHFPRMNGTSRNGLRLPPAVPTVAELFKAAGYQTICVQSNWTLKRRLSGLDRGFDEYDDGFNTKRWGFMKAERYGDEVADHAIELLEKRDAAKPLFAWFHFSDPHAPYRFHDKYDPVGRPLWKLNETEQTRARYDSEVAFTDAQIARVLEVLPKENAYVLFVADHGESLHEHEMLGHGRRVYQTEMHIPLIVHGPGIEPGRTAVPARGIDIGVTLLGLAGLSPAEGMLGTDLIKNPPAMNRTRVVETYGGAVPRIPGAKAVMAGRPPMRQAAIQEGWKLIIGGAGPELYSLEKDAMELENLAKLEPTRVEDLQKHITAWDKATPRNEASEAQLNDQDFDALKSLGYVE